MDLPRRREDQLSERPRRDGALPLRSRDRRAVHQRPRSVPTTLERKGREGREASFALRSLRALRSSWMTINAELAEPVERPWLCVFCGFCVERRERQPRACMRSRRRVAKRASNEQTRTIVTSTSAPAHAWRCQSSYGEMAYVYTCTVSDEIGSARCVLKKRVLNAVKSSGALSPAIRARASTTPLTVPGHAPRKTTLKTARARVAPSARAPSRI